MANTNCREDPNGDIVSGVRFESVMAPSEKRAKEDRQETLAVRIEKTTKPGGQVMWKLLATALPLLSLPVLF